MMELRQYERDDYFEVSDWFHARKGESFPLKYLSPIGIIAPGIAAGFLVTTNTGFCILEPFISNPGAPEEQRHKALDMILVKLCEKARNMNFDIVYGFSTSQPMLERAYAQGFEIQEVNSTTVIKRLK